MKIIIDTVAHKEQRYPTVGDWYYDKDGTLHIKVSKLSDWRLEMLIAVHELVEVLCCKHLGISQEAVDEFDKTYEETRHPDNFDEPGDDPSAPYVKQHCIATGVERILAAELGVSWKLYEEELDELP